MLIGREGWRYSGRTPEFFTPGCFCCVTSVTVTYHTFYGNTTGGTEIADNDEWSGGAWTSRTDAGTATLGRMVGELADGIAYFACGLKFTSTWVHYCDKYASSGDSWSALTDPPSPARNQGAGCAIVKFYVFGGKDSGSTALQDNDEYDTSGNSWANKTDLPSPARYYNSAVSDGTYGYSFGGTDGTNFGSRDNDRYDPSGDSWTAKTDTPLPARLGQGSFLISAKAYIACGGTAAYYRDLDEYNIAGDSWSNLTDSPLPARQWMGAASVAASAAGWITGGQSSTGSRIQDHDEWSGGSWTSRTDVVSPVRMWNSSAQC